MNHAENYNYVAFALSNYAAGIGFQQFANRKMCSASHNKWKVIGKTDLLINLH